MTPAKRVIPSIFTCSPEEHIKWATFNHGSRKELPLPFVRPPPPPGHIRVQFYLALERIWTECPPDLECDIPLETNGELNLKKIKQMWGLERCIPVDPMRWTVVRPTDRDRLNPLATRVLTDEYNCMKVIELSISEDTAQIRAIRRAYSDLLLFLFTSISFLISATPIPAWTRQLEHKHARIHRQVPAWLHAHEAIIEVISILIAVTLGYVIFHSMSVGSINLEIRQRAWKWARTGEISL